MATRYITLSMPEEFVRRAEVAAAERDMSVSALAARLLEQVVGDVHDDEQVWADERRLMVQGIGMQVGEVSWTRDDVIAAASISARHRISLWDAMSIRSAAETGC